MKDDKEYKETDESFGPEPDVDPKQGPGTEEEQAPREGSNG